MFAVPVDKSHLRYHLSQTDQGTGVIFIKRSLHQAFPCDVSNTDKSETTRGSNKFKQGHSLFFCVCEKILLDLQLLFNIAANIFAAIPIYLILFLP